MALKARADTAYRCEWEPGEQAALDAALSQFPAERFAPLERYVRVAALLPRKCVRDVALRCAWLRERGARKRKADEAPAGAASAGGGGGVKKAARRERGQSIFAVQAKAPAAVGAGVGVSGAVGSGGVVGGVALGMGIGVPRIPPMAGLGPAPGLAMGAPPAHLALGTPGAGSGGQLGAVGGGAALGGGYLSGGLLCAGLSGGVYGGAAAANGGGLAAGAAVAASAGDDQLPNHGAAMTGGVEGPVADLLEQNYAIFQEYKKNMAIYKARTL